MITGDAGGADSPSGEISSWAVMLSGKPLATGGESAVFERPGKPSQVIKVPSDKRVRFHEEQQRLRDRLPWRQKTGPYRGVVRAYRAYFEAVLIGERLGRPPPLAHPRGLVLTDRGIGQVSQKIRAADGSMAPTLRQLHSRDAIDDRVIEALNDFARDIYDFNIVATDLRWKNLVYETYKGRNRFVMIDGFGVRTLLPVRRWSRWLNRRKIDVLFAEMAERIRLQWDAEGRRFSRPRT